MFQKSHFELLVHHHEHDLELFPGRKKKQFNLFPTFFSFKNLFIPLELFP